VILDAGQKAVNGVLIKSDSAMPVIGESPFPFE